MDKNLNGALDAAFSAMTVGLSSFLDPISSLYSDSLLDYLASKYESRMPPSSVKNIDVLEVITRIVSEYEDINK